MGYIELKMLKEARKAAYNHIKDTFTVNTENDLLILIMVFTQLLNCVIYRLVGKTKQTASLNDTELQLVCNNGTGKCGKCQEKSCQTDKNHVY